MTVCLPVAPDSETSWGQIPGFAFHVGDSGREVQAIALFANGQKIPRRFFHKVSEIPSDWIPVGTVPWCEAALGRSVPPDYYPGFLSGFLYRKVWRADSWPLGRRVFIKPADTHKRFTGFATTGTYKKKRRGPYWCSEIVSFKNEWRYYVQGGTVVAAHWYWGDEQNTPAAPKIDIEWPSGWCGTGDFGELDDGRIALVEAHPPFAAGWYGTLSDNAIFANWLAHGWRWLRNSAQATPP